MLPPLVFRFPSFLPASLPLSVSRVSLQARAVSEFWRSTEGWEPFMVRIPNPDTTLRLPHTCTTSRARASASVYACVCMNVRVRSPTYIRARTRVLLDVRISICLECIVSYVLNEHSAALMYSRTRTRTYIAAGVWRKLHEDLSFKLLNENKCRHARREQRLNNGF